MTTSSMDRTLILLRHANAESGAADHDRDLTSDGWKDARAAGAWLHTHDLGADEVLCSTAERTRQTTQALWEGGCCETDVRYEERIYNARPEALLEVVRDSDEDASVVMVVGHAPGIPAFTSLLADGEGSPQAHELLAQGFPTTSMAILTFAGHWRDLAFGAARLDRFHIARA
ncbi:MAG: histidine phosphatase family protein [Tetrasphaera jenkinsii]|jgi:phosphohistidine phosphatase|nr:histidine phosphatase family protein [Tetrasphaera jenkinsii]